MKKYIIYRIADEDIENYNQHELVGVEYGEDIDDAMDRLIEAICEDLSEKRPYFAERRRRMEGSTYGYVRVSTQEQHEARQMAAMRGFGVAEENIVVPYGIIEQESDQ